MYLRSELHILTHGEDPSDSRPESAENGKVFVVLKTSFKYGCFFSHIHDKYIIESD